jgi:hypothetical protein
MGLVLGRTVRIAMICRARIRKAAVLMAQGYPVLWKTRSRRRQALLAVSMEQLSKEEVKLARRVQTCNADGTAHCLRQYELIIRLGQRRHHQPKDMKKRPSNDERPRSVVVEYYADDRPQGEQEEQW